MTRPLNNRDVSATDASPGLAQTRFFRFLMAMALLGAIFAGCGRNKPQTQEQLSNYSDLRLEVVKRLQSGQIVPDATGVASLPEDLKGAAADARVYTGRDPSLGRLVAFNLTPMRAARGEYLLYAEQGDPQTGSQIQVGPCNLRITGRTKAHWFQAAGTGAR